MTVCCLGCLSRYNTTDELVARYVQSHLEQTSGENMEDEELESIGDTESDATSQASGVRDQDSATPRARSEESTESGSEAKDHIIISDFSKTQSRERTQESKWTEDHRRPIGICDRQIEWSHEKLLVQWSRGQDSWETREALNVDQAYIDGWLNELEREKEAQRSLTAKLWSLKKGEGHGG